MISRRRAIGASMEMSGRDEPFSHLFTAGADTPSLFAISSCVRFCFFLYVRITSPICIKKPPCSDIASAFADYIISEQEAAHN